MTEHLTKKSEFQCNKCGRYFLSGSYGKHYTQISVGSFECNGEIIERVWVPLDQVIPLLNCENSTEK